MRGAIRARSYQARARIENTCDGVDFRRLESLFKGEWRQDCGHALGEHRLAGTGWPDHQDIVTTSAGDLDGTLGGLLSTNILEIDKELLGLAEE